MIKKIFFLSIFCSALFEAAFSQEYNTLKGYVITSEGDSIVGLAKDKKDIYDELLFKSQKGEVFKELTPSTVKYVSLEGGREYVSTTLPEGKKAFILRIINGQLSLYQYYTSLYVTTADGALLELKHEEDKVEDRKLIEDKRYVRTLIYLTSDCPRLKGKIEETPFNPQKIFEIIEKYNECIAPGEQVSNKKVTLTKWRAGVRLGVANNGMVFPDVNSVYYSFDFETSRNLSGGMFFNASYNGKLFGQVDLNLIRKKASYSGRPTVRDEFHTFDITYLDIPISIYYMFPTKSLRPFISVGGVYGLQIKNKTSTRFRGIGTSETGIDDELGVKASIGIVKDLNGKNYGLEYSLERTEGNRYFYTNYFKWTTHQVTLRFDIGLSKQ